VLAAEILNQQATGKRGNLSEILPTQPRVQLIANSLASDTAITATFEVIVQPWRISWRRPGQEDAKELELLRYSLVSPDPRINFKWFYWASSGASCRFFSFPDLETKRNIIGIVRPVNLIEIQIVGGPNQPNTALQSYLDEKMKKPETLEGRMFINVDELLPRKYFINPEFHDSLLGTNLKINDIRQLDDDNWFVAIEGEDRAGVKRKFEIVGMGQDWELKE